MSRGCNQLRREPSQRPVSAAQSNMGSNFRHFTTLSSATNGSRFATQLRFTTELPATHSEIDATQNWRERAKPLIPADLSEVRN